MNYIIFKTDGSILTQNLEYYIQQGNSGDEIFVGWEDANEDDIAIAVFTLPNKQTNTIAGIYDSKTIIVDEEEQTFNGWTFTLTLDQTTYNGLLQMAIRINRNNQIVVSYPIGLIINETGVMPDTDSGVTISLEEGKKSRQSFVIKRLRTKINLYYNRTFSRKEFVST